MQALRQEKEGMQGRLKELESGIAALKGSSYTEAAHKRWVGGWGGGG